MFENEGKRGMSRSKTAQIVSYLPDLSANQMTFFMGEIVIEMCE